MLADFMKVVKTDIIGKSFSPEDSSVDNVELIKVNEQIQSHGVEVIGKKLRSYMTAMKAII
jgi:ketol-acid reductoisomerase